MRHQPQYSFSSSLHATTQRNAQNKFNTYRLSNDDTRPVVEHDPAANGRVRMNVDLKDLRHLRLQVLRQHLAARIPQHVRGPVRLQRVKAFKVQKHVGQCVTGRVAVAHRHDIRPQFAPRGRTVLQRRQQQRLELRRNHHGGRLQSIRQEERETGFQRGVIEDRAVQEADQQRFVLLLLILVGFPAQQIPNQVGTAIHRVDGIGNRQVNVGIKGGGIGRGIVVEHGKAIDLLVIAGRVGVPHPNHTATLLSAVA